MWRFDFLMIEDTKWKKKKKKIVIQRETTNKQIYDELDDISKIWEVQKLCNNILREINSLVLRTDANRFEIRLPSFLSFIVKWWKVIILNTYFNDQLDKLDLRKYIEWFNITRKWWTEYVIMVIDTLLPKKNKKKRTNL